MTRKQRSRFTDADFMRQREVFRAAFDGLRELPMPTIAAVHGYALGGGFEIALCCDLIVADETSVLGLPEVTRGIVPGGGGTQTLPRRVGHAIAADLLLTGRKVEIDEAARLHLIDRRAPAGAFRLTQPTVSADPPPGRPAPRLRTQVRQPTARRRHAGWRDGVRRRTAGW